MADKSIDPDTPDPTATLVRYDLGRPNWDSAWIPDLAQPGEVTTLNEAQRIDILILGDGFAARADFEARLQDWLDDFFDVDVYERFRGAFRIRAMFRQSIEPVTAARQSYYRLVGDANNNLTSANNWWESTGSDNDVFRARLFADMGLFDFNPALYPADLDVSDGGEVIHNPLAAMYANCVVTMLANNIAGGNPSGFTRRVPTAVTAGCLGLMLRLPPTPLPPWVNVAFGANALHEFGHAFAYLEDEYINGRDKAASRSNPTTRNLFTVSNLSFGSRLNTVPWQHLSPWGRARRQGAGSDPEPTVGWLWRGGENDTEVWHAEYHCLMNGRHDNYLFTPDAANDPTAQADGSYDDETGANLRSDHRYCLWCQEIVAMRILEKTGQLAADDDPESINTRGERWYTRWRDTWRDRYWQFFDLDQAIADREQRYGAQAAAEFNALNNAGLALWRSPLYQPMTSAAVAAGTPGAIEDDEMLLLMSP